MQERELVKIKSDNPAHPHGYYIQFKDKVKPEDIIYGDQPPETDEPVQTKKRARR